MSDLNTVRERIKTGDDALALSFAGGCYLHSSQSARHGFTALFDMAFYEG
ncbi:MAG: hypothetical protein KF836_00670 [Fimbriimonadaceae bacterium]|nr:hypothetical protein [Fimbriimonadaceae bacterium]